MLDARQRRRFRQDSSAMFGLALVVLLLLFALVGPWLSGDPLASDFARQTLLHVDQAAAALQLRRSAELDPTNVAILNNLAWQLATSPDAALRDGPAALRWARRAVELAGENPGRLDTLAAALAENGQFDEALRVAEQGLHLAREQGVETAIPNLQKALGLYKVGKPYRSDQ